MLYCHKKHHFGSLTLSDICCGGINCMGGICVETPDFDPKTTFLLDRGDWYDGVSSENDGIKLTEFGLIPLKIQERIEKESYEERKNVFDYYRNKVCNKDLKVRNQIFL